MYGQNGINNQPGMSPLARFLLGLFTGMTIAAPITALITNNVNKKREEKAVQTALIQGENNGIAAYNQMIRGEISKGTVIVRQDADAEFVKRINSDENGTNDENNATVAVEKSSDGSYIEPDVYLESAYQPGTFTKYSGGSSVNGNERRGGAGSNPYLQGIIEDPEERIRFERKMASMQFPDDDINNYDLRIDDEEATQEAGEFSESHVKYLEMIRMYKNVNGDIPPMTISREQFANEHILEKVYVNWYDEDDVFEENDRRIEDPYYTFGFVSGHDMFSPERVANREDPDICHVRNLKLSTDFEITRTHGSYSRLIEDGEVYYRGEAIASV